MKFETYFHFTSSFRSLQQKLYYFIKLIRCVDFKLLKLLSWKWSNHFNIEMINKIIRIFIKILKMLIYFAYDILD